MVSPKNRTMWDKFDDGDSDASYAYRQMISRVRRRADALQARRWKKLSHHMSINPFIDSKVRHGGGLL